MPRRILIGAVALAALSVLLVAAACRPSASPSLEAEPASSGSPRPSARIAFVRGGDVYVQNTADGAEMRLTSDGGNTAPWWATDGQQLFFERQSGDQRQTWRWQPGAAPAQVQPGVWSPDGKRVAFSDPAADLRGPATVWVEADGRRTQVSPPEADAAWTPLAWSPDGSRLALSRIHLVPSQVPTYGPLYPADGALWLIDSGGGQRRQVLLPAEWPDDLQDKGWPDAVRWAPSAREVIVWVGPPSPCASCRADGAPMVGVRVGDGSTVPLGSSLGPGSLAWMPNDDAVVVQPSGRETYHDKHLFRVDPACGRRQQLTSEPQFADVEPGVSPDGRQVVFARSTAQQDPRPISTPLPGSDPLDLIKSRRLWMISADGSGPHQLTFTADATDESAAWTHDGQWIIFVRWRAPAGDQPAAELWAIRPDGSDAQRVVAGLQLPKDFNGGFGYYGALGWPQLFAVAP